MKRLDISAAILAGVLVTACGAVAQQGGQGSSGAPPAATGPDTETQTIENPPLSGLDEPSFEPGFGARSYLVPKAQITESVTTNPTASIGTNRIKDVTRALGSLDLQKLWKIHPLDIDYTGGVVWYHGASGKTFQVHTLAGTQRYLWRTGQLAFRDAFSYLPSGSFGFNSFGGAGGLAGGFPGGLAGGGGSGLFTTGSLVSLGNQSRVTNMSILDITQSLSPRSTVTLAGGFGYTNFLNNPQGYLNSQLTIAQAGYSYQLTRQDQIAVSYAFQEFHFPSAGLGSFNVNVWQALYGHRISGKLSFSAGGGPQWIHANGTVAGVPLHISQVSGVGRLGLVYRMSTRTNMNLNYTHYATPGSGFFAGAHTDTVRYDMFHQLTRKWSSTVDTGFTRNSRIIPSATSTAGNAKIFSYWYAGAGLQRQLGRQFRAYTSYQYDRFLFGSGFCPTSNPTCGRGYDRHVGLIGLEWTPRPIRLD